MTTVIYIASYHSLITNEVINMSYISDAIKNVKNVYMGVRSRGLRLAVAATLPILGACASAPELPTQDSFREFRDTVIKMKTEGENKFLLSGAGGPLGTPEWSNGFRYDEYRLGKKTLLESRRYKGDEWDNVNYGLDVNGDGDTDASVTLIRDYFGPGKHLIGVPIPEGFRVGEID